MSRSRPARMVLFPARVVWSGRCPFRVIFAVLMSNKWEAWARYPLEDFRFSCEFTPKCVALANSLLPVDAVRHLGLTCVEEMKGLE